jgi:hypothetical protein
VVGRSDILKVICDYGKEIKRRKAKEEKLVDRVLRSSLSCTAQVLIIFCSRTPPNPAFA